jgi:hypothetical protein
MVASGRNISDPKAEKISFIWSDLILPTYSSVFFSGTVVLRVVRGKAIQGQLTQAGHFTYFPSALPLLAPPVRTPLGVRPHVYS